MPHLVFVYGTLKEGYPNFHVNRGQRLAGDFVTVDRLPLFILGDAWLPWLVNTPGEGDHVTGQVYAVDDEALAQMDRLEQIDEPGWYERRPLSVRPAAGGAEIETLVYFGNTARVAREKVHLGPLAEYTLAHAPTYREARYRRGLADEA